jgi:hypothetical protein
MASRQEIKRSRAHLADERHSAALYETLAHVERDISRKLVFGDLAASERAHAKVWADKLRANGQRVSDRQSSKTFLMRSLVRVFGTRFVLPTLATVEFADRSKYAGNPDTAKMSEHCG